jgi:cytochrome c nitrite reductase small subunit
MDEPIRAPEGPPPKERGGSFTSLFPFWVLLVLAGLLGGIVGLGGFTVQYAQGLSYLTDDPQACANCHIMREYYDGWNRGSHKHVAVCNDCHAPHDNLVHKYAIKGINGLRHSYAFTTGDFPEPIRITPLNRDVTQHACLTCHADLTVAISHRDDPDSTDCLRCHAGVGHGK